MQKNYKCSKCGTIVQIIDNPETGGMAKMCMASFPGRISGICGGQLLPIDIKPGKCGDCD